MKAVGYAAAGAAISVLAFPPFGPGWLIIPGVILFLWGLRSASSPGWGLAVGAVYGFGFYAGLMWWLSELGLIAAIPLVLVQGAFPALYGWWLSRHRSAKPGIWLLLAGGGWGVMELIRYRFPVGGLEWGAAGYALSDLSWAREMAWWIGTSGLTILVATTAAAVVILRLRRGVALRVLAVVVVVVLSGVVFFPQPGFAGRPLRVAVVQGSTPCPFEHCPNERFGTYLQHLELTRQIPTGSVDLVVWSEGSTGSTNADPVLNPEVGEAIGEQARRLGAWFLVGGDRPVSESEWVNANVVFDPEGQIVGEYRKQHPVPFGEYIPARPLFAWIPALAAVPRDMIPGGGPETFEVAGHGLGSVISFEGAFSRYARGHVIRGAEVIVVATNEGSYGTTPASDQLIGITRMRAAELGVPIIHSAVTGKSTIIDRLGQVGEVTGLGTQEILTGQVFSGGPSPYALAGDWLMALAAVAAILTWWSRRSLVGSRDRDSEEE
ncbi:MAG: apolipoprotein N-acyltransferase [Acidimicrobiia bacterium]